MLDKIFGKRLTDGMLKLLLLLSIILIGGSLFLFWSKINLLEQKWFEIAKSKEVVVMDETGNVWQKKLYSDTNDIAVLFGISFLKNALSYNYKNYNKVYQYISNLTSSTEITNEIKEQIEDQLKEMKIVNGEYSVIINNYRIKQEDNKYKGVYLIKHSLNSDTKKSSNTYIVFMDVSLEAPTVMNSSGYFISKFEKEKFDVDKHMSLFQEN